MKNLKSIFLLAIMFFACQTVLAQTDKGIEYYNNKDYANAVISKFSCNIFKKNNI